MGWPTCPEQSDPSPLVKGDLFLGCFLENEKVLIELSQSTFHGLGFFEGLKTKNGLSQSTIRARNGAEVEVRWRGAIAFTRSLPAFAGRLERTLRAHRLWTAVDWLSQVNQKCCRSLCCVF
jgi:hypothetical protein